MSFAIDCKISMPENWWVDYLGKPWEANPNPPHSYNCGELVRGVHRDFFGIETVQIPCDDANSRLQCMKAMLPSIYGLAPLPLSEKPRTLDVAFLGRRTYLSHCGVAVETSEGLKILHCPESVMGVCLDSLTELKMAGFPQVRWFRHKELEDGLRRRGWLK